MGEIIAIVNPFTIKQKVCVKKDNKQIYAEIPLNDLKDKLPTLAKEYEINHIFLNGNPSYLLKIKDEIINNKYDKQNLHIDIL